MAVEIPVTQKFNESSIEDGRGWGSNNTDHLIELIKNRDIRKSLRLAKVLDSLSLLFIIESLDPNNSAPSSTYQTEKKVLRLNYIYPTHARPRHVIAFLCLIKISTHLISEIPFQILINNDY